ncbi:MAG: o-succinylbenzoate synthase [Lentimonas sp.]
MRRQIAFLPYQRAFSSPLRTSHGLWHERKGFIVRIEDSGRIGYGEIAPIPDFGTETIEAAGAFLLKLMKTPEIAIPVDLPCCAFGLSAALATLADNNSQTSAIERSYPVSALLPAGKAAKEILRGKSARGYQSFKWKIGVEPMAVELALFAELVDLLPEGGTLRLDVNGGLEKAQLMGWIDTIAAQQSKVEYLEQPLPVGQEALMANVMNTTGVAIALDESLNGSGGRRWLREWQGPLVVKPALMGDVDTLRVDLKSVADRVVLSSVFETAFGVINALTMANLLPELNRPIGFDTFATFDDALQLMPSASVLQLSEYSAVDLETLWHSLHHSS